MSRERLPRAAKEKAVAKKAKLEEDGEELHDLEGADGEDAQISFIHKPRFKLPKASKKAVKDPLSKLPLDIWASICQQGILEASDLLVLSRLSRSLRRIFCHNSSEQVWHACFESMQPSIPVLPDISAPHIAHLFQGKGCDHCGKHKKKGGLDIEIFFALRKRLCIKCAEQNVIHEDEVEEILPDLPYDCLDLARSGPYQQRLRARAHHGYRAAQKSIQDWVGEPRCFYLPELVEWQEICETEDDTALIQQRKKLIHSLAKFEGGRDLFKKWQNDRIALQKKRAEVRRAQQTLEREDKIDKLADILVEIGVSQRRIEALGLGTRTHQQYWHDAMNREEWTDEDRHELVRQVEEAELKMEDENERDVEEVALASSRTRLRQRRGKVANVIQDWFYDQDVSASDTPSSDDLMCYGPIAQLALDASGANLTEEEIEEIEGHLRAAIADRLSFIKSALCSIDLGDPHTTLAPGDVKGQATLLDRPDMFWRCTSCNKLFSFDDVLRHFYENHRTLAGPGWIALTHEDTRFREAQWNAARASRRFASKLLSIIEEDPELSDDRLTWKRMQDWGACWVVNGNVEELLTWKQVINTVCNESIHSVQIHKITDKEKAHAAMDEHHIKATSAVYRCPYCHALRGLASAVDLSAHVAAKHADALSDDDLEPADLRRFGLDRHVVKMRVRDARIEREKNGCEEGCCICSDCEECLSGDVNDDMLGKHMLTTT